MAGRPRKVKTDKTTSLGRVRMFEVLTPNEKFTGVREKVRFQAGRAEIPEPRPADFFDAKDASHFDVIAVADEMQRSDKDGIAETNHEYIAFLGKYPGLESYLSERDAFRHKVEAWRNSDYRIRVREVEVRPDVPFEDVKFEG